MSIEGTTKSILLCTLLALCAAGSSSCKSGKEDGPGQWPSVPADAESVRPYELALEVYQVGDRLLVVARGSNSTGGFTMRLERRGSGEIVLRNVPPKEAAIQVISPFELAGWFAIEGRPQMLRVNVASDSHTVVVRKAERLFESP